MPPIQLSGPKTDDHKGTFGRVMLVGGCRGMAGSITLSSIAALHTGSGLVSTAVPECILDTVAGFHPSLMTIAMPNDDGVLAIQAWSKIRSLIAKQDAIGVGPGMTTGNGSVAMIEGLWAQRRTPVVFDADALNVLAEHDWLCASESVRNASDSDFVLTPHRGELARLVGLPLSEPEKQDTAASELAHRLGITIVIKGGPTRVVSSASDSSYVNTTGNPGMATAGSGDVLTGAIVSLLGRGLSGWDAARLGVWVHGLAGDHAAREISQTGMTSVHLVDALARVADQIIA